jgi:phospholipid-binding lipoprotein MlaA
MNTSMTNTRSLIAAVWLALLMALSGCATNHPRDPLEPLNRAIYSFNDGVDSVVMKPLASGYRAVLPQFVRTGIGNFFSNLDDITVILNSLLQLKIPQAVSDSGRFIINSTLGVLGLIDVATHLGLEKHNEDFGQTLGYWGIGNGPYLVLPFLGPSTLRDALGRWVDSYTDVIWREDHKATRNRLYILRAVHNRSRLLESEKIRDTAAIDPYSFTRDAYLQRRRNLIFDGNPPPEADDDEPAPKPRSESGESFSTVVVDQFGSVITGGTPVTDAAQGPVSVSLSQNGAPATSAPPATESKPDGMQRSDAGSDPASAGITHASPPRTYNAGARVRVWLPGAQAR